MSDWKDSPMSIGGGRRDSYVPQGGGWPGYGGPGGVGDSSQGIAGMQGFGLPLQGMSLPNAAARVSPAERRSSTDRRGNSPTTGVVGAGTPPGGYEFQRQFMNQQAGRSFYSGGPQGTNGIGGGGGGGGG
eukprot:Rhum_TRINITY_DN9640_c0_g1::Rhum_TRINITY_DN9640_c0_g1_i2::g.34243::m.34243